MKKFAFVHFGGIEIGTRNFCLIEFDPLHISADQFQRLMGEAEFAKLSPDEFCNLMAKETRVCSKNNFAETLRESLSHIKTLSWSGVTSANHERFYHSLLRLNSTFIKTLEIMMEKNSKFCPRVEGKETGLAQIYLDKIDKAYANVVLTEIDPVFDEHAASEITIL